MNDDADNLCSKFDAYLDGEASVELQQAFVAHQSQCPACRDAVEQQRWIDALLQSDVAAELETPPEIRFRPRRPRRWLVAAAAAAVLVAYIPLPRREGLGEGRPAPPSKSTPEAVATVENPSPNPSLPGRGTNAPAAKFVSAGSAIGVSVASPDQRVTVVKLYPTATASRRWARESALRAIAIHSNGG
jgi:anti-sigma factor RsiW